MNTTEPTTIKTTFTCPETGMTILAEGLADEYGSLNHTKSARIRLIRREGVDDWILKGDDLYGGDAMLESEWNQRDIVVDIWSGDAIVIDDDDLPGILSAAATACAYLHDLGERHEIVWDGNRYVGQFAVDEESDFFDVHGELEHKHKEPLRDLVAKLDGISEQTVDAGKWANEYLSNVNDEQLRDSDRLVDEVYAQAKDQSVRLIGSVQDVIDGFLADRE